MTPNTNTPHAYTISHSFLPGHRVSGRSLGVTLPRRISPVLTAHELRLIVCEMVD